jgi:hypothetical protein
MKKIVRLTEQDLARIVRRVINEEQINESKKLKALTLGLGLALNIGLSSCNNKTEVKSRIPELKVLVKDQFRKANNTFKTTPLRDEDGLKNDGITEKVIFEKITDIKESKKPTLWFVVINVQQTIDGKIYKGCVINTYEENKDGEGRFTSTSLTMPDRPFTHSEVNHQIEYFEKHGKWDRDPDLYSRFLKSKNS